MNDIELAQLFVDYAKLRDQLELTKDMIIKAVLDKGETVKLAGITATYYKPSKEAPNYQGAVTGYLEMSGPPDWFDISDYQTVTITTKWKDAAEALKLENIEPGEEKPARVVVK